MTKLRKKSGVSGNISHSAGLHSIACVLLMGSALVAHAAEAGTDENPASILVIGIKPAEATTVIGEKSTASTLYEIGKDGIALKGSPGGANIYHALSLLPGVDAGAIDAYGLVNLSGGTKGLRVRGDLASHGAAGTLDGVPISGLNPGPGMMFLVDSGNLAGVTLAQGPIAPNTPAFITSAGVADMQIDWAHAATGGQAQLATGANGFMRGFARLDSGEHGGVSAFGSASWTTANKWRGSGRAPDGNLNVTGGLGLASGGLTANLLITYVRSSQYSYMPLSFAQASNLDANRSLDYAATLPANAMMRWQYYGYNHQNFEDTLVLGDISYAFGTGSRIVIKPYYMKETGQYWDGMASGMVREWLIDHDSYGVVAEAATRVSAFELRAGIWHGLFGPPGPPTAWKMYMPQADGSLMLSGWPILSAAVGHHSIDSVYAMATGKFGTLQVDVGARYVHQHAAGLTFYNPMGVGDVSYAQALTTSTSTIAWRSATPENWNRFLPYGAAKFDFSPNLSGHVSVGRNYGSPGFDAWPAYQMSAAAFNAAGLTADAVWHQLKPETSTAVDAGLQWKFPHGSFSPTLYFADSEDRPVAYDPGVGLAYTQNVAKSRAYGAQAMVNWAPVKAVELFGSVSWGVNKFRADLPTVNNTPTAATRVNGLTFPDAPRLISTLGATLRQGSFSMTPLVAIMSSRFVDTANTQQVGGRAVVDLTATYTLTTLKPGTVEFSVSVTNLFDKGYIDTINTNYYQQTSTTNAALYPGAPRTVFGHVGVRF